MCGNIKSNIPDYLSYYYCYDSLNMKLICFIKLVQSQHRLLQATNMKILNFIENVMYHRYMNYECAKDLSDS